ncbi:16S rRNA (adenine(1518)-N(6)/adenine(1519)-N(6))-dimethyltransferase RsmA [Gilvimarinus agarilyticus]|uniref:16S rRNA (adenine(1518)-N(6)/adenine(1519)-N(6))- dimethyltransferase RsmA n=1 Tax=unclassified Gilvimarinus TaxID=2642066 RepID=UPI001C0A319E|nr:MULTISPECIES: 16S rRNA (adenine(1518)-N(6)/adenine(1519)-N(6))-dimethyltransferase RsmA [unclassified Gilvimarinus]MBU2887595.1 16S rRNA (adenine(1518)-N(6)/adenine(1519)-N(6))-dimethyltransferase RsmA [Gilvimarinus agarilyticus]MDO6572246.1 16S rRNA (adenine(1518)-N(6)/adenine(1519)-N(6))-dimethyltransferase RsmA [Gilvimarinus sp. 2_MG-2023]MDO6746813.1 16S rRNA (adenine(1518)-N(6)/adenine(1519)-N(6))-dimethyltransferase RsmA [Gilvimarinus sp. 1_MG-2023]
MKQNFNPGAPHKARKRFGQNFLIDHTIINQIARSVAPRAGDIVVEIGPGQGALTEPLAESAETLHVIELDRDLVPWLKVRFEKYPGFALHQADALKFDFAQLAEDDRPLRIVGNLPYNISTPLIFHLISYAQQVQDMHFMLQKEVVKRLAAQPGSKAYGRLTVMAQYYCDINWLFDVPPGSFDPAPKVDSAIVRLAPYKQLPHPARNVAVLEKLVTAAFGQRRKTLRNALKTLCDPEQLQTMPVDLSKRAEALSIAEFVELSDAIEPYIQKES